MIYNGISPYLYLLAVCLLMDTYGENVYIGCFIVYLYVVDVVLAVLIHRDFKKSEEGVVT